MMLVEDRVSRGIVAAVAWRVVEVGMKKVVDACAG